MNPNRLPAYRSRRLVALVVTIVVLGGACSGGSGGSSSSSAGVTSGSGVASQVPAFAPCNGPKGQVPASPVSDLFGNGNKVESVVSQQLGVRRDAMHLEPALVASTGAELKAPQVPGLQQSLLDDPEWSHATVGAVAAPVLSQCAQDSGEVVPDVLSAVATRTIAARGGAAKSSGAVGDLAATVDPATPLLAAFQQVFAVTTPWPQRPAHGPLAAAEPQIKELSSALGPDTEKSLAAVILGMRRAEDWRLDTVRPMYPGGIDFTKLAALWSARTAPPLVAQGFDTLGMSRAGATLALAVEHLKARLVNNPLPPTLDLRLATPLGEVILRGGSSDDTYSSAAPALIVDQGGSDTYNGVVGAPAMPSIPLSVVIDMGGDDKYNGAGANATQGAGVLSFGFLIDHAGNDQYTADDFAQGSAFMGVGALFDEAGDDTYTARASAQGSGHFGIGVAIDGAGRDTWRVVNNGQGYGGAVGAGLLLDAAGDDVYEANDSSITNPSPQSPEHNTSLSQGAGFGDRGQHGGIGGGTGMLVDLAGNDKYSCGVMCQGVGYYFGDGILYDGAGNDSYRGVWYVQGAAAHYALGTLIDESGNDTYETVIKGSRGEGHDESAGFFLDGAGDDTYTVASLSNGSANDAGFGFSVDLSGADTYTSVDLTEAGRYGQVTDDGDFANYRGYEHARSVALFLDLGGADRYVDAPAGVGDGATWKLPGAPSYKLGPAGVPREQVSIGQDVG